MALTSVMKKLFGTASQRQIKRILPVVNEINRLYEEYHSLTDDELRAKTDEFRARIKEKTEGIEEKISELVARLKEDISTAERERLSDEKKRLEDELFKTEQEVLDELLPEAYAVVKEACRRLVGTEYEVTGHKVTWNMIPFDVQLIGAIVLHQGKIAEMATGEGKTLVATMPLYLNALVGKGAHLVTVNDYLARRDAEWMGIVYNFLGLTVGCIQSDMDPEERKKAYAADITYGTNNEFGFDYLRDNMKVRFEDLVQRGHYYAIVDEVDSVLIDEARTPLIISGPVSSSSMAETLHIWRSRVERLYHQQMILVNKFLAEAERLLSYDEEKAARLLLLAKRGLPKNKKLLKLKQDGNVVRMIESLELALMRDKKLAELDEELYFAVDERENSINLTEKGRQFLSPKHPEVFVIPDLTDEIAKIESDSSLSEEEKKKRIDKAYRLFTERSDTNHAISQLLKAYVLFERDVDYVVMNGKVIIVDEFTGRLMPGRRYSDGLHSCLEAKEGVRIEKETQTLATITLQNYFRMYRKLAGMTGTAETEAEEFWQIYKLDTVVIPTNKPVRRVDYPDKIYRTKREKYNAVIREIERLHKKGIPVLVGTISVEVSETLSRMLKRVNIPHNVLNAKNHAREAEIVALAGQPGAVTIATNMAGRGTDIRLGKGVVRCPGECKIQSSLPKGTPTSDGLTLADCLRDVPCGLHIIGTERHEARRIDRQLRGRAGRQGDPGSSRFFISLEDDLMRLFGGDSISSIMLKLGAKEGEAIESKMVSSAIERAQKRVEAQNFAIRKRLLEYDDVMNRQRTVIYSRRREILEGENLREEFKRMFEMVIDELLNRYTDPKSYPEDWNWQGLKREFREIFLVGFRFSDEDIQNLTVDALREKLMEVVLYWYGQKEQRLGEEMMRNLERLVLLVTIDSLWKDHLYFMDQLKEGISLRAYGQKDPLIEYKREAYEAFLKLLDDIDREAVKRIFRAELAVQKEREHSIFVPSREEHAEVSAYATAGRRDVAPPQAQPSPAPTQAKKVPIRRVKIGRNDPCPCGSGKKYKDCCGRPGAKRKF